MRRRSGSAGAPGSNPWSDPARVPRGLTPRPPSPGNPRCGE